MLQHQKCGRNPSCTAPGFIHCMAPPRLSQPQQNPGLSLGVASVTCNLWLAVQLKIHTLYCTNSWSQCPPPQKEASGGDVVGIAEEVSPCLRSYLYCSDGGSDQSKYKKMVAFILRESKYQFFVSISCTLHAQQLVVKDTFVYLDHWCGRMNKKWKYFPSLAKLIYVWRDNATQCLAIWRKLYGDLSAAQHGFKLPAKAIAGRWGSVFACHRDLLGNLGAMGIWELQLYEFWIMYIYILCKYTAVVVAVVVAVSCQWSC